MPDANAGRLKSAANANVAADKVAPENETTQIIGETFSANEPVSQQRQQLIIGEDAADPSSLSRPHELFEQLVQRYGSSPAVISAGKIWSYEQIDARANQLARLLLSNSG